MTKLGKWIEKRYLEYQMKHGLMTLKEFAEVLGISRPYLSLILSGERSELSEQLAITIAERLNDYTLLDLLGYERPAVTKLPPGLRASLDSAVDAISREYDRLGITDFSGSKAMEIAKRILDEHGFTQST